MYGIDSGNRRHESKLWLYEYGEKVLGFSLGQLRKEFVGKEFS